MKNEHYSSINSLTIQQKRVLDSILTNNLWLPIAESGKGLSPQFAAMLSPADELFFGGQAGGGKSDLAVGLAVTMHTHSLILRRTYKQLGGARGLIQRSHEIIGEHGRYNGQEHVWRGLPDDRIIEFGSCQYEQDKEDYKGRPHDLKVFDELPEFSESMYRFITAWTRTTISDQRVRIVGTGNPPTSAEGEWVINYWGPWLNSQHPNPARPGELRWFAVLDGEDVEVAGGEPFEHKGETIYSKSRTFIPARLDDNPFLRDTDYERILQGLPEPLRSQLLYGDFNVAKEVDPWQVIPTEWVQLAQQRWQEQGRPDTPISAVGVDPSRGGKNETVLSRRHDSWFDKLLCYPGVKVPDGPAVVALVIDALDGQNAPVNIEITGIGSSGYDFLRVTGIDARAIDPAGGTDMRDKTDMLKMRNVRAAMWWSFREALDPKMGDNIALPDDRLLLADLCAPRYKVTAAGITIEAKDDPNPNVSTIKKRLGRSPDRGEAVIIAHYQQRGFRVVHDESIRVRVGY